MALYFISYDLRKKRDYKTLYAELEKYGGIRVLESVWCIKNDATYTKVRDYFKQFIDEDDGLLVISAESWAGWRLDNLPMDF